MAKRKKKKEAEPPDDEHLEDVEEGEGPGLAGRFARLIFRPRLLLLGAVAVCLAMFYPRLRSLLPELQNHDEYRLTLDRIEVNLPPRWVPRDFVEQVAARAGLHDDSSLLDPTLTSRIADAFAAHPWVLRVVNVHPLRSANSAGLKVTLQYRSPAAMVSVEKGLYPVDGDGILLPPADFSASDAKTFPLIENVASMPAGQPGEEWGDAAVAGAARLAKELAPHWNVFGLKSVYVAAKSASMETIDDITYELRTTGATRIVWGRAPGSHHPGELTSQQKVGRLKKYLADFGSFDDPHGAYEIDIRHWQEISRRPVSSASAPEHR